MIQNVLSSPQGKIYLASADVSDCDVDYVLSLAGEIKVKPFVILNNYQPQASKCYTYEGSNPRNTLQREQAVLENFVEKESLSLNLSFMALPIIL
jgi:hypothetical protein